MRTRYKILLTSVIVVVGAWFTLTAPIYPQQERPCDVGFEDTVAGHCVPRIGFPSFMIASVYAFDPSSDDYFSITEKQARYNIPYVISNGMIDDMTLFCKHGSLLIDVSSQSEHDVNLDVEIPRNMLDPKTNGEDNRFFILRDGDEIDYDEIPYQDHRKLSMSFSPDADKIEIIHAFIPELKPPMCKVADSPPYSSILPPLKQFKSGVPTDEIQCRDGLMMLLSPKDSRPVCVTGDTANKLIPRHWVILVSRG